LETIRQRADLDRLVAAGGALAVQVLDPAHAPSAEFSQRLEAVGDRLGGVVIATLDRSAAPGVAGLFGIDQVPALVLFRAGVGLYAGPAPESENLLEALLGRALSLDMHAVRTEMSRERAAAEGLMSHRACPTSRRGGVSS